MLDYKISENMYRYEKCFVEDKTIVIELLFVNGALTAVSKLDYYGEGIRSAVGACTAFPPYDDMNITKCFQDFTNTVIERRSPVIADVLSLDEQTRRSLKNESDNYKIITAAFAPILVSGLVILGPIYLYQNKSYRKKKEDLIIRLGDNMQSIEALLDAIPAKAKKLSGGNGTFYIPGSMGLPLAAVGIANDEVVWVLRTPAGVGAQKYLMVFYRIPLL